jgi:mannose-6-phosphate isomerase
VKPVLLGPNQPRRFYRGGAAIAQFRSGGERPDDADLWVPEDWIASSTPLFGEGDEGLTVLPDGRTLRDAVLAEPEGWLGPAHVARWGADTALLVKLLDAGQRLPVHAHPDRSFARRHLGCRFGKTEAWVVIGTHGAVPVVYLGFAEDMAADDLRLLVEQQDTASLLGRLNQVSVRPGDAVLVPAGTPHAIGAGVFVTELQEPTDWSVLMEWEGFQLGGGPESTLGLGWDLALSCVDRGRVGAARLDELRRRVPAGTGVAKERLLPAEAEEFFRADMLRGTGRPELSAGFAVLVCTAGAGSLDTESGASLSLERGAVALVPHAAGPARVTGDVEMVRCRPAAPESGPVAVGGSDAEDQEAIR